MDLRYFEKFKAHVTYFIPENQQNSDLDFHARITQFENSNAFSIEFLKENAAKDIKIYQVNFDQRYIGIFMMDEILEMDPLEDDEHDDQDMSFHIPFAYLYLLRRVSEKKRIDGAIEELSRN